MSAKFSFRTPTLTYLVNTLHSSLLLQASLCFCFIPETFSPLQNLQERHCLKDIKFWSCIARKSKSRLSFPRPLLYWRSNTSYIFYKNLYFLKTLWKKSKKPHDFTIISSTIITTSIYPIYSSYLMIDCLSFSERLIYHSSPYCWVFFLFWKDFDIFHELIL